MMSSTSGSAPETVVATTARKPRQLPGAPCVRPVEHNCNELGKLHAELLTVAATITDPAAKDRLAALFDRFATLLSRPTAADDLDVVLAPRETEVLAEVAKGGSNAEIAKHLGLQVTTVKSYLQSAMRKLDAANRVHAVYRARQIGLIT